MSVWIALLFGLIQGLTEFLPVSSSAHLSIFGMLTLGEPDLLFTLLLHLATLIAVCIAYRKDVGSLVNTSIRLIPDTIRHRKAEDPASRHMLWMMVVSLLPLLVAVFFKDMVETACSTPWVMGLTLLGTAVLLVLADRFGNGQKTVATMTVRDAAIIGLAQMFAVMPGLSRSGTTLAFGLFCGLDRENAARYSFLLSIPTIVAAAVLELADMFSTGIDTTLLLPYLLGCVVAGVTGYLAIGIVRLITGKRKLSFFSLYCAALAVGLFLSYIF